MRKMTPIIFLLSLLLSACGKESQAPATKEPASASEVAVTYVTTETFDEEVLNSDVPVLVDFTAVWCVPCKVVDPIIISLYPEMHGRAKVFKLDIDDDPEIYERLGVSGVPHILFFKDGVEQDRIVSPQPREIYVQYLEALIDGRSTLDVSLQLIEDDQFRRHFVLSRRIEDLHTALESKPDLLSAPLENGQTPLSMILNSPSVKQNDQIELALANGATPTTRDLVGLGQCDEFVAKLDDDPEAINRPDPDGATPLYLSIVRAFRLENGGCVDKVLEAGADAGASPHQRYDLGRMVVISREPDLLNRVLDAGMDPLQTDINGNNVLHWAAYYRNVDAVQTLVDRGVDVGVTNLKGETAADVVHSRIERLEQTLQDGVDYTGKELTTDYIEHIRRSMASNKEILSLLEG